MDIPYAHHDRLSFQPLTREQIALFDTDAIETLFDPWVESATWTVIPRSARILLEHPGTRMARV